MVKRFKLITTESYFFIYQKSKANIPLKSAVGTRRGDNKNMSLNFFIPSGVSWKEFLETQDANN